MTFTRGGVAARVKLGSRERLANGIIEFYKSQHGLQFNALPATLSGITAN